jgi:DNA replication protein DnaC
MRVDFYKKTDPEYWREICCKKCKICGGTGVISINYDNNSVNRCVCTEQPRFLAKMHDTEYGLNPKYYKWNLSNAFNLSTNTKKDIKKYFKLISDDNPYRNLIIKGHPGSGKSSVAAIIYKFLMNRQHDVSIVRFPKIVSLARVFLSNSSEFNNRSELYRLLLEEEFLIIEDVDGTGHVGGPNFEKFSYGLMNDVFSHRANHPRKATIITIDADVGITTSTLGSSYYNSIYVTDVEDDKICEIKIEENKR